MPELNLKPSSKGVMVLVIVAVVILFSCVLGYIGAAGKLKTATDLLEKKERVVAESKQIAQKLEKSRLDYLDACSQVRYLESSLSTRDYVPTLLKQLEALGKSVNLKVLGVRPEQASVQPQSRSLSSGANASEGNVEEASKTKGAKAQTAKPKPYNELKISLEVQGNYTNVLDFLYRLTTFPKIIAVNALEMSPGKDVGGAGSPTLIVKMTVTAFILREDGRSRGAEPASSGSASTKGGGRNEAG